MKNSGGRCLGKTRRKARSGATGAYSKRFWIKSREVADTDCGPQTMRRAYIALKHGKWESLKEKYSKEGQAL